MKPVPLLLCAALLAATSTARADAPAPVGMEIPPGWSRATPNPPIAGAVITLQGPESSSFVVASAGAVPVGTAGALAYLTRVLDGVRAGSKMDFRSSGVIETRMFRNGVSVQLLRATLGGSPRLVLALIDAGGPPLVATLSSAAPEAMLTPLFGGLRPTVPEGAVRLTGVERSLDGQFEVALGGGLRARTLTVEERGKGAVMALQSEGSEVIFIKLSQEDAAAKDQAELVRATAADAAKVPFDAVSPARLTATPAGPAAVCAWTAVPGSPDLRLAAGFLPWAYWGYSVIARGPRADQVLDGVLAALKPGPDALPKLLADTPRLEAPDSNVIGRGAAAAAAVAAALILFLVWRATRKKGNVSP